MTKLHSIDRHAGLPLYPLPIEATLSTFDWWPFSSARLLTPRFRAHVRMENRGRALALWDHAMREGQPAGTLPIDVRELGVIAECAHDYSTAERLVDDCLPDTSARNA